jgi:transposase
MGDLYDFEKGQIISVRLVGAPVIKTATLLGISTATISKVMSAYTNHWKTTFAKRNRGRESPLTEKDRRTLRKIVSENHTTTAA